MGNLLTSTIGRKLIMSVSGLFLVLFLLFHTVSYTHLTLPTTSFV